MIYSYYKQWGNNILVRYKKEDSHNTISRVFKDYKPSLYTIAKEDEVTKKESIYGHKLRKHSFETIKDAKAFIKQYKEVDGIEVHGNDDFANQFIIDLQNGETPDYDPTKFNGALIDIEVYSPEMPSALNPVYPVTSITVISTYDKSVRVFFLKNGSNSWNKSKSELDNTDNITFTDYDNEKTMLLEFIEFFSTSCFDFISGWNSMGFDTPYLVKRAELILGSMNIVKRLSPFNMINERETEDDFKNLTIKVDIIGVPDIDYMKLYKKHIFTPRINYKLDTIAEAELGDSKLSYEEAGSLLKLYEQDTQKYVDYNIKDTILLLRLEEKLGLFGLTYTLAYLTLANFEDTFGTVKIWEKLMAKYLYKKNIVPPPRKFNRTLPFDGAYVHPPVVGKHHSLESFDLDALYPHIKQQLNIGQETYIEHHDLPLEVYEKLVKPNYTFDDLFNKTVDTSVLKKYNLAMSPTFAFYKREKMSIISEINRELYALRKIHKRKMLDAQQMIVNIKDELKNRGLSV